MEDVGPGVAAHRMPNWKVGCASAELPCRHAGVQDSVSGKGTVPDEGTTREEVV